MKGDERIWEVLRISPEPMTYVSEREVHRTVTEDPAGYLGYLNEKLTGIARGSIQVILPPKEIFTDPNHSGDFRVMPCVTTAEGVLKTVKVVGTNRIQQVVPDQITVGKALRLHPEENFVSHLFEACLLSSARTGAAAALALAHLAAERSRIVIVGAGRVGYYTGLYLATLEGVREIGFHDLDPDRSALAARMLGEAWPGVETGIASEEELATCQVVVLSTPSTAPIIAPGDVEASLVVSLGADAENQRELDPSWPDVADLYVDSAESTLVGDLAAWLKDGRISARRPVDLLTVLREGGGSSARRMVFISTGTALFDNLTIGYLLARGTPRHR